MILKGKESLEIPALEQEELTEALIADFWKNCPHQIVFEKVDPKGSVPIQVCKICGKEVFR